MMGTIGKIERYVLCVLVGAIGGVNIDRHFVRKEKDARRGIVLGVMEVEQDLNGDGRPDFAKLNAESGKYDIRVSKKDGSYEGARYIDDKEVFVTESGRVYDILGELIVSGR